MMLCCTSNQVHYLKEVVPWKLSGARSAFKYTHPTRETVTTKPAPRTRPTGLANWANQYNVYFGWAPTSGGLGPWPPGHPKSGPALFPDLPYETICFKYLINTRWSWQLYYQMGDQLTLKGRGHRHVTVWHFQGLAEVWTPWVLSSS